MNEQPAPDTLTPQPANSLAAQFQRATDRLFRALRRPEVLAEIDHPKILARVEAEAGWSHRYAFMVLMSAGISILGLLLGSPAVIIGAMLVSPLMGPIIGLGFAIAVFDWVEVRKSFAALVAGALLAIAFTAAIVFLSPLTDRTSEIMARTRPNLFDLLVAIFSALAGAYATVRGRGETIVGVAIATALMPPLAVVGFGLATGDWPVFSGALALFVTNFVAIALAATIMAKFYGFGSHLSPEQSRWQGWAIFGVFLALSVPLGLSLRQIAWETLTIRTVREALAAEFGREARIEALEPDFAASPPIFRTVVLTPSFQADAAPKVEDRLREQLGRPISLNLHQVVLDQDVQRMIRERPAESPASRALDLTTAGLRDQLALLAGVDASAITLDRDARRALVRLPAENREPLVQVRAMEARVTARYPDWEILLVPPPGTPLPTLVFPAGEAVLDPSQHAQVDSIGWALARWQIPTVRVVGLAASTEPAELARARAQAVADQLELSGVVARVETDPAGPQQRAAERELGLAAFRAVRIET